MDIKARQIDCLTRLLKLNRTTDFDRSGKDEDSTYKILVLDSYCRDLVSPLLRLNQLRALGVTLHLSLESARQPIQEVPAVYLVQGTAENVDLISRDLANDLYGEYYLSFASRISRPLLEGLAQGAVKAKAPQKITRVEDQYTSFISLEKRLFSLGMPGAYSSLNDPTAKDTEIEAIAETIVDRLFCVFVTLGVIPILKCPPGGAAEHISALLDDRIRSELKAKNNLFAEASSGLISSLSRPLCVIFDRNFDLVSSLQHCWSYKPLVQDVLGLHLNRVTIKGQSEGGESSIDQSKQGKSYDVDDEDSFWDKCGSYSFPKIAEEVEIQLQNYKKAVEEINKKTADAPGDQEDSESHLDTQNLMAAVSSLPELTEKKKLLDKHASIATTLLGVIKERTLDQYFNTEEDIVSGKPDFPSVLNLLKGNKGSLSDKLRLAAVYLLSSNPLPVEGEIDSIKDCLGKSSWACDVFSYLRMLCANKLTGSTVQPAVAMAKIGQNSSESNLLAWAEKNFSQSISSVSRSVKNLLSGAKRSPVVSTVEALMGGTAESASSVENFKTFDPKAVKARKTEASIASREAIVFVVGGGNYLEKEALDVWASSNTKVKQVVFGSTEIVSPEELLEELKHLSKKA